MHWLLISNIYNLNNGQGWSSGILNLFSNTENNLTPLKSTFVCKFYCTLITGTNWKGKNLKHEMCYDFI